MGQTFLLFAVPLIFTAAAKMAVPTVRPLGHGVLLDSVFCPGVCCPAPVRA
jgi:hypothetical protein